MRNTMNVRCCCSPGLVLGRLPYHGTPRGRRATFKYFLGPTSIFGQCDVITHTSFRSFVVDEAWIEAPTVGPVDRYRPAKRRHVTELAYNSNHADIDDLVNLKGFELICDLPADYFGGEHETTNRR